MTFEAIEQIVSETPSKYQVIEQGQAKVYRLVKKNKTVYVFSKRSRRYGYPLNDSNIWTSIQPFQRRQKDPAEIWEKSWRKVELKLTKSGLWPEVLANVKIALDIGYDKIQKAYEEHWVERPGTWDEKQAAAKAAVGNIDPRLNTEILYHMTQPAKVKAMYFGPFNHGCKTKIYEAMNQKVAAETSGRAGYDVSWSYKPDTNSAWYSEEYRNCGNGHYYIAISADHALFWEDD